MNSKIKNLIGTRFNRLLVKDFAGTDNRSNSLWKCICDCGEEKIVSSWHLRSNLVKSCGCLRREKSSINGKKSLGKITFKDYLVGKRFGRLIVLKDSGKRQNRNILWLCKCDCGKEKIVVTNSLKNKNCSSCGCLRRQYRGKISVYWKGYEDLSASYMTRVRLSAIKRNLKFKLTIKDAWEQFLKQNRKCALSGVELTIEQGYTKYYEKQTASLDRIDSSKGYTKDNIQWVHKDINNMKQDYSQDYFIDICTKIAKLNQKSS
jgi:hypothetical protein